MVNAFEVSLRAECPQNGRRTLNIRNVVAYFFQLFSKTFALQTASLRRRLYCYRLQNIKKHEDGQRAKLG